MDNITVKEKGETIIMLPTSEEFLPTQSPHKKLTHSEPRGAVCNGGDYWKMSVATALSEPMFCGHFLPKGMQSVCIDSPLRIFFYFEFSCKIIFSRIMCTFSLKTVLFL